MRKIERGKKLKYVKIKIRKNFSINLEFVEL